MGFFYQQFNVDNVLRLDSGLLSAGLNILECI